MKPPPKFLSRFIILIICIISTSCCCDDSAFVEINELVRDIPRDQDYYTLYTIDYTTDVERTLEVRESGTFISAGGIADVLMSNHEFDESNSHNIDSLHMVAPASMPAGTYTIFLKVYRSCCDNPLGIDDITVVVN